MPPCHGGDRGFESHLDRHYKWNDACIVFFYDLTRIYTKLVLCIIVHINYSDLDPVSLADMNVEKVITKELGLSWFKNLSVLKIEHHKRHIRENHGKNARWIMFFLSSIWQSKTNHPTTTYIEHSRRIYLKIFVRILKLHLWIPPFTESDKTILTMEVFSISNLRWKLSKNLFLPKKRRYYFSSFVYVFSNFFFSFFVILRFVASCPFTVPSWPATALPFFTWMTNGT